MHCEFITVLLIVYFFRGVIFVLSKTDNSAEIESYRAEWITKLETCNQGEVKDITDATNFKAVHLTRRNKNEKAITLTMNTDGAPVFKSNKFSVWPVYVWVNELPPKRR